jgi:hypothetical protein
MSQPNWGPRWITVCVLLSLGLLTGAAILRAAPPADSEKAAKDDGATKRAPRLPAYYAGVVNDKQHRQISAIQEDFAPQIQQKRDELKAILDKQEAAISKLLSKDQRQQIEKLRVEARQKRQADSSSLAAGDAEMEDEAPTAGRSKSSKASK